jgi:hypothetical protein
MHTSIQPEFWALVRAKARIERLSRSP